MTDIMKTPVPFLLTLFSGPLVAAAVALLGSHHVWWAMPVPLVVWLFLMSWTGRGYEDWN